MVRRINETVAELVVLQIYLPITYKKALAQGFVNFQENAQSVYISTEELVVVACWASLQIRHVAELLKYMSCTGT